MTTPPRAHRWRPLLATILILVLAEPVGHADAALPADTSGTAAAPPAGPAGPPDVLPADGSWSVTLLTGDVVDVRTDAEGRVDIGIREHTGPMRSVRRPDGEMYVMPTSVTPLLDRALDRELFNVTGLVRQGYDDESTPVTPLVVQYQPGTELESVASAEGSHQPLPSIDAVATALPKSDAQARGDLLGSLHTDAADRTGSAGEVAKVWLDRRIATQSGRPAAAPVQEVPERRPTGSPPLDGNLTQIGADDAWAAGLTGAGVQVAVLDTGIDAGHPDLAGQVAAQENFSDSPDAIDRNGHGTHVASLVAGTGSAAGGARRGVAPGADLYVGKVLADDGFGLLSWVIAGMEWAAPQVDVINMSLGDDLPSSGDDPLSMAVDQLSASHDALFVVAAGNAGPLARTVGSPGAADRALTVGAVDDQDDVAEFSSRGPLADSDELKPELVAPGVDVVAARAAGTSLGDPVNATYTRLSGTSMATPHVAGAAAVLAEQHPDWTADQLKHTLLGSADPTAADGYDGGAGRLDVGDGIDVVVHADRDVVDVSLPDERTEPHVETLSWTNTSDQPQTVALDASVEDRRGGPVDAISVSPAELTLAPGATASATVTVDGPDLQAGFYSGVVGAEVASGSGESRDVRTPIGVRAAPEMAELTIEATVPGGRTDVPPNGTLVIYNLDDAAEFSLVSFYYGTSTSVEVPEGRYAVVGDVAPDDVDAKVVAQVGDPDVTISGPTTVRFDGAAAVPLDPTVTGSDTAPPVASEVGVVLTPAAGAGGGSVPDPLFQLSAYSWYPSPPVHVTEMRGDPERSRMRGPVFRLQAPPLEARVGEAPAGTEPLDLRLTKVPGAELGPGAHTFTPVDVGDGTDLEPARGELAVVQLPVSHGDRSAITHRAVAAGVRAVVFVDEARPVVAITFSFSAPWAPVPVLTAGGPSARLLREAAVEGEDLAVTVTPSAFVYDIALPDSASMDPSPVLDRADQDRLAVLQETFHRDPGDTGRRADRRRAVSVSSMELDVVGPLPRRRTAHVTPDVTWQSYLFGQGTRFFPPFPPTPAPLALSITPETTYSPGSRHQLRWLRPPMAPGLVGVPPTGNFCQPQPVARTVDTMVVQISAFQDGPDRYTCSGPNQAQLSLEVDGTPLGTVANRLAEFAVPAEPGRYRLTYQQSGSSPYPHRSTTTWSFRSAGDPDRGLVPLPLLVADYRLPLDSLNRPTGDDATVVVRQTTGTQQRRIEGLRVWTSTDDGTTWQRASVSRETDHRFLVRLPDAAPGTNVSLRVDGTDTEGSRIQQTLLDAYLA